MGLCGLAYAPLLDCFLQELEKLQPDLDHYLVAGGDTRDVGNPPLWATAVERNTTALMKDIGTQLQLTDALLRVESLRIITAENEVQQISRTPPDRLSLAAATIVPSQQYIMAGNENVYQGIEISGSARAHIGESHYHFGVPKASVDKRFENLAELATARQAAESHSSLQEMQKKQSEGCDVLSVIDARTLQLLAQLQQIADGSRTILALLEDQTSSSVISKAQRVNRSPSITSETWSPPTNTKIERLHEKTPKRSKTNQSTILTSILEIIRAWLSAMIMMLLMQSRPFQRLIRSARTFIRSPSMLLDNNIRIIDALDQELSLPYEHFRSWPTVLARLQHHMKGSPGESYVARQKFGLFRAAKKPQNQVMIPLDQWERSVFPGDRLLMSIDLERFDPNECPSCGCGVLQEMRLIPEFSKWFVI